MKRTTGIFLSLVLAAGVTACGGGEPEATPEQQQPTTAAPQSGSTAGTTGRSAEADFIQGALETGEKEAGLARLASERGTSDDVKAFAEKLEEHHRQANEELRQLVSQQQLTVNPAGEQLREERERLSQLSGQEFDREFLAEIIADHERSIAQLEGAANSTSAEIRQWASKTLPIVRQHLEEARRLHTRGS